MLRAAALNMLTALMGQYSVGVSLLFVAPKTLLSANLLQLQPPILKLSSARASTPHHSSLVTRPLTLALTRSQSTRIPTLVELSEPLPHETQGDV